ncbi:DUF5085 family protein [Bacillus andreraoultii]|uniref:DUF5085 family protein n=1 Tax=Bacillus andreraoultii TaxID=1499685 RepID=UPI0005A6934A|nr:DUF5085 family protein [Bacillus andreraoultii]
MLETEGIQKDQSIKYENLVSLRKKLFQEEIQPELIKLAEYMKNKNVQRKGPMISTTYDVEEVDGKQLLDMEFLFPVNQNIDLPEDYRFKPIFHLVHAIYKRHIGAAETLEETYNELHAYMKENQLQQITSGYNININEKEAAAGKTPIIDVYIGVNPSIL